MITSPLETGRLRLRPFVTADWRAVFAYTADPGVMAFIPDGPHTATRAQEFVRKHSGADREALAVILRGVEKLIGHMIFHPWFAPRTFEIGWVFHSDYHGYGYATEAGRALLGYAFTTLDAHRVIATCQPENPASYCVMEKLGLRREGHFRQCIHRGDGVWWDEFFYAILAAEWRAEKGVV